MSKHLVLVGGGHAHLSILKKIGQFCARGHRVTLVSPSPFHDYSGLGPSLVSGNKRLAETRFNIARMVTIHGGTFIEASAISIEPNRRQLKLDNGSTISYDVLSCNTGSIINFPIPATAKGKTIFPAKPIANLFHARQKILTAARNINRPLRLLVIGGGPSGCEITGNLQSLCHHEQLDAEITLVAGNRLLNLFSHRVQKMAQTLLALKPFHLLEGVHVSKIKTQKVELDDGRELHFDFAFVATGINPNGILIDTPLIESTDTELLVNEYLQSPLFSEIFGGGDCIKFQPRPLNKVGVYAVRQNQLLHHNLLAALEQRKLQNFQPQKNYLLILNLGMGRAIATGYGLSWSGRSALWLKFFFDHIFVRKFQKNG